MIVVSGLMRSGTSAAARVLQAHWISMGTTTMMPQPWLPGFCEYEDVALSEYLNAEAFGDADLDALGLFREYIAMRRRNHTALRMMSSRWDPRWGVKSPLLVLHWNEWLRAAAEVSEPVTLIVTNADRTQTEQSIRRIYGWMEGSARDQMVGRMLAVQERITKALERIRPDHVLDSNDSESIRRYV